MKKIVKIISLAVVVVIIGILSLSIRPAYSGVNYNPADSQNKTDKTIRFGSDGKFDNPLALPGYPKENADKTFLCKVMHHGKLIATVPCDAKETLLVSLEREGVAAPAKCRTGECGFCRAKLIKGHVFIPDGIDSRRLADSSHGIIHPCCSYPMSDMTLVIN